MSPAAAPSDRENLFRTPAETADGTAVSLLKGTTLSVEEIAAMVGYTNNSNFYKAFREYYHQSPRQYFSKEEQE